MIKLKNVITKRLLLRICNYNVYTLLKRNKCNYFVYIVVFMCNYFVITFSQSVQALEIISPVTEGRLIYGQADTEETIFIDNQYLNNGNEEVGLYQIPLDTTGRFVLGIPLGAPKELELIVKSHGKIIKKSYPIKSVHWLEEVVNGLQREKVLPSAAVQQRILAESKLLRDSKQLSENKNFPDNFIIPVERFSRISSRFGARRVLNGVQKTPHRGTDFAAPEGTAVLAPAAGRVVFTHDDMFYSGKTIVIDHGYGVFSSYSHLGDMIVETGQWVEQGTTIGSVGMTGRTTGPHLHFTITWFGIPVNPEFLLF